MDSGRRVKIFSQMHAKLNNSFWMNNCAVVGERENGKNKKKKDLLINATLISLTLELNT